MATEPPSREQPETPWRHSESQSPQSPPRVRHALGSTQLSPERVEAFKLLSATVFGDLDHDLCSRPRETLDLQYPQKPSYPSVVSNLRYNEVEKTGSNLLFRDSNALNRVRRSTARQLLQSTDPAYQLSVEGACNSAHDSVVPDASFGSSFSPDTYKQSTEYAGQSGQSFTIGGAGCTRIKSLDQQQVQFSPSGNQLYYRKQCSRCTVAQRRKSFSEGAAPVIDEQQSVQFRSFGSYLNHNKENNEGERFTAPLNNNFVKRYLDGSDDSDLFRSLLESETLHINFDRQNSGRRRSTCQNSLEDTSTTSSSGSDILRDPTRIQNGRPVRRRSASLIAEVTKKPFRGTCSNRKVKRLLRFPAPPTLKQRKSHGILRRKSRKRNFILVFTYSSDLTKASLHTFPVPGLQDDFYLNLIDYSPTGMVTVAVDRKLILWDPWKAIADNRTLRNRSTESQLRQAARPTGNSERLDERRSEPHREPFSSFYRNDGSNDSLSAANISARFMGWMQRSSRSHQRQSSLTEDTRCGARSPPAESHVNANSSQSIEQSNNDQHVASLTVSTHCHFASPEIDSLPSLEIRQSDTSASTERGFSFATDTSESYLNLPCQTSALNIPRDAAVYERDNSTEFSPISSISWSHQFNQLAVGRKSGVVELWDVEKSCVIREVKAHESRTGVLAWYGALLSSGGRDKRISHFDTRAPNTASFSWEAHKQEICGLAWASGATGTLASGGNDNGVYIWRLGYDKPLLELWEHQAAIKALSWCPFSTGVLATGAGTNDRHIRIWDLHRSSDIFQNNRPRGTFGDCIRIKPVLEVDTGSQVCNLMWSSERRLISTHGFTVNHVILWNLSARKEASSGPLYKLTRLETFEGHEARVLYAARSPDGQHFITGAGDQSIKLWRLASDRINEQTDYGRETIPRMPTGFCDSFL